MEVLAPLDFRQHQSAHTDWYRPYKHSGGIATPTSSVSQSSMDPFDRTRTWTNNTRPPATSARESSSLPSIAGPSNSRPEYHSPRSTTFLPPINSVKPSLPPIRSLLAEPLASPPATPTTSRISLHQSPLEHDSDYTRAHKRGRSSLAWEGRPSYTSPASVNSIALTNSDISLRRDSATQSSIDQSAYRHAKEAQPKHRLSTAYHPDPRPPIYEARTASPEHGENSVGAGPSRKRSFDSLAGPGSYDRQPAPPSWAHVPAQAHPVPRQILHTSSPPQYRAYPASTAALTRHDIHGLAPPRQMIPPYSSVSEPGGSSSRPAVYDYQLAKARKRSNLPKESTDIMKRWFEEHLDNPYPSEDEKKYFAAKAGISLTQVSNWFINHRRRCPELREQRDKKQTTGRRTATESP